jgi:hypothetical protein
MSDGKPVRCVGCGYLSVLELTNRTLRGVEPKVRETGHTQGHGTDNKPVCFVNAQPIDKECSEAYQSKQPCDISKIFLEVIQKDRLCGRFVSWNPGCTPKEHFEMWQAEQLREEMEKRRIADEERAERRLAEDRKWRHKEKWEDRTYKLIIGIAAFIGATLVGTYFNSLLQPKQPIPETNLPSTKTPTGK